MGELKECSVRVSDRGYEVNDLVKAIIGDIGNDKKPTTSCGTVPNTYAENVTYRDIGKLTARKLDAITFWTNCPQPEADDDEDTDYNDHHGNQLITSSNNNQPGDEVMDLSQTKDTEHNEITKRGEKKRHITRVTMVNNEQRHKSHGLQKIRQLEKLNRPKIKLHEITTKPPIISIATTEPLKFPNR
ncbi:hypothetical protein BSL78_07182 [Apostichopus japonicus]|uniref:Uncharacterized protein n=1 Tax=Stichopus japonicus TaxID=307972 RepID=A0A2G8L6N0_STIJA|nr:hypothetical protein BSL78_07182 [Apostichopus japonicus]